MGNTNVKKLRNGLQSKSAHMKHVSVLSFGYVREFQVSYPGEWPVNILESPMIYLIIAFFPRKYMVYGIGGNTFGELGVGHANPILRYKRLDSMSSLLEHPSNIYRGYGRFMIKTVSGELYCCGNNYRGDAGCNYIDIRNINKFEKIAHDIKHKFFVDIVGDGSISNHTILISNHPHSNFYAFGSNRRGQFGNYYNDKEYFETNHFAIQILHSEILKQNIFNDETIIKIQCGEYHTLFLSDQGNVFSCGDNLYGQCGIDTNKLSLKNGLSSNSRKRKKRKTYLPVTKIATLNNMIDIACGSYHNLCINNKYELFVFGDNPNGQLALGVNGGFANNTENDKEGGDENGGVNSDVNINEGGDDDNIIFEPLLCDYFKQKNIKICKIECGNCHSGVLDLNANCYFFGENKYGQIGTGKVFKSIISTPHTFNKVKDFDGVLVDDISLGYNHTVLITYLNEIYTFGDNQHNQCSSDNDKKKITHPWLLTRFEIGISENCRIEKVIAGSDTTLIITKLG